MYSKNKKCSHIGYSDLQPDFETSPSHMILSSLSYLTLFHKVGKVKTSAFATATSAEGEWN